MRKSLILSVSVLLVSGAVAFGAPTNYWVSGGAGNWNTAANWADSSGGAGGSGAVPTGADDAVFDAGGVGTCTIDVNAQCYNLSILSGYNSGVVQAGGSFSLTVGNDLITERALDLNNGADHTISNSFFIRGNTGGGTSFEASSGTVTVGFDFENFRGSFTHNNGTMRFYSPVAGPAAFIADSSSAGSNAFYDVEIGAGSGVKHINLLLNEQGGVFEIQHDLTQAPGGGEGLLRLWTVAAPYNTLLLGTTNYASQVTLTYIYGVDGGGNHSYIEGAHPDFPANITSCVFFFIGDNGANMSDNAHIKWVTVNKDCITGGSRRFTPGTGKTIWIDGDSRIDNLEISNTDTLKLQSNTLTVIDSGTAFPTMNIVAGGTVDAGTGTLIVAGGAYTNTGTFTAGSSTVVLSNSSSTVYNNAQAFYNLTTYDTNTVTLAAGTVSAISNQLHVVSGTLHTDDNLSQGHTGAGTFVPLSPGANTIECGLAPLVDLGATLEAGFIPTKGTLITLR